MNHRNSINQMKAKGRVVNKQQYTVNTKFRKGSGSNSTNFKKVVSNNATNRNERIKSLMEVSRNATEFKKVKFSEKGVRNSSSKFQNYIGNVMTTSAMAVYKWFQAMIITFFLFYQVNGVMSILRTNGKNFINDCNTIIAYYKWITRHKAIELIIALFIRLQVLMSNSLVRGAIRALMYKIVVLTIALYLLISINRVVITKVLRVITNVFPKYVSTIYVYQMSFDFDTALISTIVIYNWIRVSFKDKATAEIIINELFKNYLIHLLKKTERTQFRFKIVKKLYNSKFIRKINKKINEFLTKKLENSSLYLNELLLSIFFSVLLYSFCLVIFADKWNIFRLLLAIGFGIFKLVYTEYHYRRVNEIGILFCFISSISIILCPVSSMIGNTPLSFTILITCICINSKTRIEQ